MQRKLDSILYSSAVLVMCTFLVGCKVGPDYKKPDDNSPVSWFSKSVPAPDTQAAIEQNWWKHFNDPVLNTLVDKAIAGNFDLKVAEARITEARASQAFAKGDLLPTVNTVASAEREGNRLAFGNTPFDIAKPFNTFQAGFDASWELDLFGGKKRQIESATAELEATEATRDDLRVSTLAEVARTYIDIRQYQAQLGIVEDTIKADQKTVDIAKQRVKSGNEPGLDVTQASAELEQAQALLPHYQSMLAQTEYSMDTLLGEKPGVTHTLVADAKPVPVPDKALVLSAPAQVIASRPDIHMAERKLASATAQQGVQTAQLFPDVSLEGFLGLLNSDSGHLLMANSKSWDIGGNVVWPILNYGRISANIDAADARQQQALFTYQKSIVAALADVERSVTAYTKEEEHHEALNKSMQDKRHAADIARMRYKAGLTSFLEVLDAERTLYNSQNDLAMSDGATAENLIAVYKSLGGGWKDASK